ncbi:phospholipase D/Transphosphatidylase [Crinalium epipsammum PCC 9333]|uniref:Phospholipase D/Transphosphatidylase n=1 Tax=Crinalium epipsammum PCC 9333 TaxID=1173022 RepID=K9VWL1_9CYAN|nr:phospholipase D-like domain-containing protein [Crinalium epipsammum]AFZ12493.1 phospholipase D/Transphosphatidylase [Crinalium epipsammum PCC 9333]
MKICWQLQGNFCRTDQPDEFLSLSEILQQVQSLGQQHRRYSLHYLRSNFGLNFLPEAVLEELLQKTNNTPNSRALYIAPHYKLLRPIISESTTLSVNQCKWEFTSGDLVLSLAPDDPQIPIWDREIESQPGTYNVVFSPSALPPHLPQHLQDLVLQLEQDLNNPNWEWLKEAVISPDYDRFFSQLHPHLLVWIEVKELPPIWQEAIALLRMDNIETAITLVSEEVRSLVARYQETYSDRRFTLPPNLKPNASLSAGRWLSISSQTSPTHRRFLETLIDEAKEFLCLSSFRIEDEGIVDRICQKARQLQQGVWILTDLRNELLDRIDPDMANRISVREEYQASDRRKDICFKKLIKAGVRIRGGLYHLKTYISEQYAYLGSCNLTPGSLHYNYEAGIVWRNCPQHQQLIERFYEYWHEYSDCEALPTETGMKVRSLSDLPNHNRLVSATGFLSPSQYESDLYAELQQFARQPRGKIRIYTRNFYPTPRIKELLRLLDCQIFVAIPCSDRDLNVRVVSNLHAKITVLGDQVAYLGGINFQFRPEAFSQIDLVYKVTEKKLLQDIDQSLQGVSLL